MSIKTAIVFLSLLAGCTVSNAQNASADNSYFYVANTRPPDAFLSLRTDPTTKYGLSIVSMPNGTLLQALQRRDDGWWYVRVFPSGQEGWALSGQGNRVWIECCATVPATPTTGQGQQEPVGFKTPSNNIYCMFGEGTPDRQSISYLRCDIKETHTKAPPPPPDCDLEWGNAFEIAENAVSGQRVCHGDTTIDDDLLILAYESVWQHGGIKCKSETIGLTCINAMGHGFSLSKNSQRLF